jgi:archaellum biogenesis ATPase FlaH
MPQPTPDLPPIGKVFNGANIPSELKAMRRWAVWKAVWNEARQKYDKIPYNAQHYGLSTKKVPDWGDYETAATTLALNPTRYAGLGFVLTDVKGVVGIDLDNCRHDGHIAPWAREIVDTMASYTEISPSGNGLRILALGKFHTDWNNHDTGIEVYSGHTPRFLTITGHTKLVRPMARATPDALQALFTTHRKSSVPTANVILIEMPELYNEYALPDVATLELSEPVMEFLLHGPQAAEDRSGILHAAGVQLYGAGYSDAMVLSILAANDHAMDVAMAHRNQDPERALQYLWVEHCQKAKPKAKTKADLLSGFDDVSADPEVVAAEAEFKEATAQREDRFRLKDTTEFVKRQKASWIVKGLVPNATLGVIYGASGSGKSFFVLDLMAAVARAVTAQQIKEALEQGKEIKHSTWRNLKLLGANICWVAAEGQEDMRKRVQAYCIRAGIDPKDLPMAFIDEAPNFLEAPDVKAVIKQMRAKGRFDIVVIDTLAQVMAGGNENSGEDMGKVLAYCREITRLTGAMVILIHHSGKDESRGARGWSGLRAAADFEFEIIRADEDRVATVTKMKGGADGGEYGFRLETLVVGKDDDGDDETTCVVISTDSTRATVAVSKGPKGDNKKLVVEKARDMTAVTGSVTTNELVAVLWELYPKGKEGARDQRKSNVARDIKELVEAKFLCQDAAGMISVPTKPSVQENASV